MPQKPSAIVFLTQCRLHGLRTSLLAWLRCLNPLRSSVVRYTSSGISAFDGVGRAPARHAARGHGGWPGLRDRARTLEYAARATRDESWRSVRFGSRRPAVATRERVLSRSVLTVLSSLRDHVRLEVYVHAGHPPPSACAKERGPLKRVELLLNERA